MKRHCLALDLIEDSKRIDTCKKYYEKVWREIEKSIKDTGKYSRYRNGNLIMIALKRRLLLAVILCFVAVNMYGQHKEIPKEKRLEWFKDAKLGIFIHWGIYAVNGIDESWSFYNNYISYEDYMKQLSGFNAKNYNPEYWAELIKVINGVSR